MQHVKNIAEPERKISNLILKIFIAFMANAQNASCSNSH